MYEKIGGYRLVALTKVVAHGHNSICDAAVATADIGKDAVTALDCAAGQISAESVGDTNAADQDSTIGLEGN